MNNFSTKEKVKKLKPKEKEDFIQNNKTFNCFKWWLHNPPTINASLSLKV